MEQSIAAVKQLPQLALDELICNALSIRHFVDSAVHMDVLESPS